jgi:uncharacterized protein YkwD
MLIESLCLAAVLGFADDVQPETAAKPKATAKNAVHTKATTTFALWPAEKEIIDRTNAERRRYGLPPLVADPSLVKTARNHCYWMASAHSLQHASGAWAENIAQGQTSPGHAVSSWMGSSGHRANILNRRHRRIGVAGYRTPRGDIFWCQQFME